jgi:hypothetical protein
MPGYTFGGKTSTAETGSGDPHAWFIGFIGLPQEKPSYAVAIVLEAGGVGGQVALLIGRDLLVAADRRTHDAVISRGDPHSQLTRRSRQARKYHDVKKPKADGHDGKTRCDVYKKR